MKTALGAFYGDDENFFGNLSSEVVNDTPILYNNTNTNERGKMNTKYPYGKTATIKVYDLATGAFLRHERQGGMPETKESEGEVTIDADAIRERVAQERANILTVAERDYEGSEIN